MDSTWDTILQLNNGGMQNCHLTPHTLVRETIHLFSTHCIDACRESTYLFFSKNACILLAARESRLQSRRCSVSVLAMQLRLPRPSSSTRHSDSKIKEITPPRHLYSYLFFWKHVNIKTSLNLAIMGDRCYNYSCIIIIL